MSPFFFMLEKQIEKKVCDYATKNDFLCFKFLSPQNRGVPDRVFIKDGDIFFIEFKREGGLLSKQQIMRLNELRNNKMDCYVVYNVDEGKEVIDARQNKFA